MFAMNTGNMTLKFKTTADNYMQLWFTGKGKMGHEFSVMHEIAGPLDSMGHETMNDLIHAVLKEAAEVCGQY